MKKCKLQILLAACRNLQINYDRGRSLVSECLLFSCAQENFKGSEQCFWLMRQVCIFHYIHVITDKINMEKMSLLNLISMVVSLAKEKMDHDTFPNMHDHMQLFI
jgi:hypothetical protein